MFQLCKTGRPDASGAGRRLSGFWHQKQDEQGEKAPPQGHADKTDPHGLARIGQPETLGHDHHQHIHQKQQPAAQVSH